MHAGDSTSTTSGTRRLVIICGTVIALAVTAVTIAIGSHGDEIDDWDEPTADEALVIYDLYDGEPNPELNRSYRITMGDGSAHLAIYTGDRLLYDETINLPDDVWQRALDTANDFHGSLSTPREGCVDPNVDADQLTVLNAGNAAVVVVYVDGCTQGKLPDLSTVVEEVSVLLDVEARLESVEYDDTVDTTD